MGELKTEKVTVEKLLKITVFFFCHDRKRREAYATRAIAAFHTRLTAKRERVTEMPKTFTKTRFQR